MAPQKWNCSKLTILAISAAAIMHGLFMSSPVPAHAEEFASRHVKFMESNESIEHDGPNTFLEVWQTYSLEDRELMLKAGASVELLQSLLGKADRESIQNLLDIALRAIRQIEYKNAYVAVGSPINWQQIEIKNDTSTPLTSSAELQYWNHDSDLNQEFLILGDANFYVRSEGSLESLPDWSSWGSVSAWDVNSDGILEFVVSDLRVSDSGELGLYSDFINSTDDVISATRGAPIRNRTILSDMNGNGIEEVILYEGLDGPGTHDLICVEQGAREIFEVEDVYLLGNAPLAADVDGDGLDELIVQLSTASDSFQLAAVGIAQEPVLLSSEELNQNSGQPILSHDINEDGVDDLLFGSSWILSGSHESISLETPDDWEDMNILPTDQPDAWLLDTENGMLVAAKPAYNSRSIRTDCLCMWDLGGNLVYLEYFGEEVLSICTTGDSRAIAVLTESRIMTST